MPALTREAAGRRLLAASAGIVALLPPLMALASRSAPATIAIAAVLALSGTAVVEGWAGIRSLAERCLHACLRQPEVALLGLVVLSAASLAWSARPLAGLRDLGEAGGTALAGVVLLACLRGRMPNWATMAAIWCLAGAGALMIAQVWLGMPLQRLTGGRAATFLLNRAEVVAVLALFPLAALALPGRRFAVAAAVATTSGAVMVGQSGTAVLGLVAGIAGWCAAWAFPRLAPRLWLVGVLALLAVAPVQGDLAAALFPERATEVLSGSHARERIEIWQSFGEVVRLAPLVGTGFGSTKRMDADPVAARVPPDRREMLGAWHPHDAFLQVWVELGACGALLVLLACQGLAGRVARLPPRHVPPAVATMTATTAMVAVGFGAWQGWWIAGIALADLWMTELVVLHGLLRLPPVCEASCEHQA